MFLANENSVDFIIAWISQEKASISLEFVLYTYFPSNLSVGNLKYVIKCVPLIVDQVQVSLPPETTLVTLLHEISTFSGF